MISVICILSIFIHVCGNGMIMGIHVSSNSLCYVMLIVIGTLEYAYTEAGGGKTFAFNCMCWCFHIKCRISILMQTLAWCKVIAKKRASISITSTNKVIVWPRSKTMQVLNMCCASPHHHDCHHEEIYC